MTTATVAALAADWRLPMEPDDRRTCRETVPGTASGHFDETGHWRGARACPVPVVRAERGPALVDALQVCLARLPPNVERAYTLRERQGWELEEIAATLGITTGDCAVLLHRARVSIHAMLMHGAGTLPAPP